MTMPEARVIRLEQQRNAEQKLKRASFSAKTEQWLDLMVLDGKGWREAAQEAGIRIKTARTILGHPRIAQAMQKRAQMIRTAEGPKNVHLAVAIRDRGLQSDATAAQQKVSLEAAKYLDGTSENGTVNFNGPTIIAGYVIDLSGPSAGPKVIGNREPITIDHQQYE